MARQSRGRGTAAAFGMLLLLAGLVGGGLLFVQSQRRPTQAVEGFARAPIGCTTTLRFTERGTFFVYQELSGVESVPDGGCEPLADPAQTFDFELTGPDGPVVPRPDDSLTYDTDRALGSSVARIEITTAGQYEIVVVGDDPAVVAAIGRDPDDGVQDLRRRAMLVAVFGVVLGVLLLWLAGRRSKQAAKFAPPDGATRATPLDTESSIWSPQAGSARQEPVNPHDPPAPVSIAPPLDEVDEMLAARRAAWGPPVVGEAVDTTPLPVRPKPTSPEPDDPAPERSADTPTTVESDAAIESEAPGEPKGAVAPEPAVEAPGEPKGAVGSEPAVEARGEREGAVGPEPAVEAPGEPKGAVGPEPAVEAPGEPKGAVAPEPAVEAPGEPKGAVGSEPAVEAPGEPKGTVGPDSAVEAPGGPKGTAGD